MQEIFINPRNRKNPKKWSLDYNHFTILSKYIYDYKSLVNYMKVCTRTSGALNMKKNLSVNIAYPEDWWKLQTQVIYTDREISYPYFMKGIDNKEYFGTHSSFHSYLKGSMYLLCKDVTGDDINLLFIDAYLPNEMIQVIASYAVSSAQMTLFRCYMNISASMVDIKKTDIMALYDNAWYKHIERDSLISYEKHIDGIKSIIIKVDIPSIFDEIANASFSKTLYDRFVETPIREGKHIYLLNGIKLPLYDDRWNVGLSVLKYTTEAISFHAKTRLCGISIDKIEVDTKVLQMSSGIRDLIDRCYIIKDTMVVLLKMYDYDGLDNNRCTFTFAYLPNALYNAFMFDSYNDIEPLSDDYVHIKGTDIIVSRISEERRLYMILKQTITFDFDIDKYFMLKGSRFITDISIHIFDRDRYLADNKRASTFFQAGKANTRVSFLGLKYGYYADDRCLDNTRYAVDFFTGIDSTFRAIQHDYGYSICNIKDIRYDNIIRDHVNINRGRFIVSERIPQEWMSEQIEDTMLFKSTYYGYMTYKDCINSGIEWLAELVRRYATKENNFVLYYLLNGDKNFVKECKDKADLFK